MRCVNVEKVVHCGVRQCRLSQIVGVMIDFNNYTNSSSAAVSRAMYCCTIYFIFCCIVPRVRSAAEAVTGSCSTVRTNSADPASSII